jgi:hypothetical protein
MDNLTATYSPEDNKLRLYSLGRLDAELYARVRAAGFIWAPKQDLFVVPMWTPGREDLLLELCGEIGDENTSLADRAAARADRFDTYSEHREADAVRAEEAVHAITENIPFGQPILVGHHSEKRARKDAEKIQNGMRRAVNMWETSAYWAQRAAGAVHHADYKARPDVTARRIKGLEADLRKQEREKAKFEKEFRFWSGEMKRKDGQPWVLTHELAIAWAGQSSCGHSWSFPLDKYPREPPASQCEGPMGLYSALSDGIITAEQARDIMLRSLPLSIQWPERWIAHYQNRLVYERALLGESGGTASDKVKPEKGGACRCWVSGRGCWSFILKVNKVSVSIADNWGNGGKDFSRTIPFDKLRELMSAAEVKAAREAGRMVENSLGFMLKDAL